MRSSTSTHRAVQSFESMSPFSMEVRLAENNTGLGADACLERGSAEALEPHWVAAIEAATD